jgi:hypothetical protein
MKGNELLSVGLFLGAAALMSTAAVAQDEVVPVDPVEPSASEAAEEPETRFFLEYEYDYSRTLETDLRISSRVDPDSATISSVYLPEESDAGSAYRIGWNLPNGFGQLVGSYRSLTVDSERVVSSPGQFVFAVTETWPFAHGVADDGFADAVKGTANFRLRDAELDWRFSAMDRPRFSMGVSFGLRKLFYGQDRAITYSALDAGLPPLISPGGDDLGYLRPNPDRMRSLSDYTGRGIQVGIDATVPIFEDRLRFEASASLALLRGTVRANYDSLTWFYVFDDGIEFTPISFEEVLELLQAGDAGRLGQQFTSLALDIPGKSSTTTATDLSLGLRSRLWKGLELAVGARMSLLQDVVYEIRPNPPAQGPAGSSAFAGVDERWSDAALETFYAAVSYHF